MVEDDSLAFLILRNHGNKIGQADVHPSFRQPEDMFDVVDACQDKYVGGFLQKTDREDSKYETEIFDL